MSKKKKVAPKKSCSKKCSKKSCGKKKTSCPVSENRLETSDTLVAEFKGPGFLTRVYRYFFPVR